MKPRRGIFCFGLFAGSAALTVLVLWFGVWLRYPALNAADSATIAFAVYGIGAEKAEAIVLERTRGGEFRDWTDFEDRMKGQGIGPVLAGQVRKSMRLGAKP